MYKLSQSTIEKLKTYVYLLIDPRTKKPFYVGKGHGNRINHHLMGALEGNTNEKATIKTIREIQGAGQEVGLVILRHGVSEEVALEIESAMIDFIDKDNLTNLAQGHHATDRGMMTLDDIKIKYEADPAFFDERVILININKRYKQEMSKQEIYEATRKAWKVSERSVGAIKIACAVYLGIVREVFVIHRWLTSTEKALKGRSYFEGEIAPPEIRNKYIHKSVAEHWKQGSQNPIKYVGVKREVSQSFTLSDTQEAKTFKVGVAHLKKPENKVKEDDKMDKKSQGTRQRGLAFLKKYLGELPKEKEAIHTAAQRPFENNAKGPGWWIEPPLKNLVGEAVHLLCGKEKDFYYLCVPVMDIKEYIKQGYLHTRNKRGTEVLQLHLSAKPDEFFNDLQGKGNEKISFAKYIQTSKK